MAKTNLDAVIRALVGIDRDYLGTVADIANRLNSPEAPRWRGRFNDVLQEGLSPIEPPPPLLVFDTTRFASVELSGSHNPREFWQTTGDTPARYVWTNVFAEAKPVEVSGIVKLSYADLPRATTAGEILKVPEVGNFGSEIPKLSKIIAKMIAKQPNGEPGDLLNDGKANLFPCGSLLVGVDWRDSRRRWDVRVWGPDDGVGAGRRVFSGNLIH